MLTFIGRTFVYLTACLLRCCECFISVTLNDKKSFSLVGLARQFLIYIISVAKYPAEMVILCSKI